MPKKEYMTDSQGRQVPSNLVKDIDKKRDETVRRIAEEAVKMKSLLTEFKEKIRDEIYSFAEMSAAKYGVK
jgi:hypothetical protein